MGQARACMAASHGGTQLGIEIIPYKVNNLTRFQQDTPHTSRSTPNILYMNMCVMRAYVVCSVVSYRVVSCISVNLKSFLMLYHDNHSSLYIPVFDSPLSLITVNNIRKQTSNMENNVKNMQHTHSSLSLAYARANSRNVNHILRLITAFMHVELDV